MDGVCLKKKKDWGLEMRLTEHVPNAQGLVGLIPRSHIQKKVGNRYVHRVGIVERLE